MLTRMLDVLDFVAATARSGQDALLTAERGRAHQPFHQAVEGARRQAGVDAVQAQ
ncbi:hypothetical protein ACTMTF_29765 [Nonomuraea sp. ZG12]|uniref:hypothetical protein n=1 Tax=Nonomuraea sp. ZG12 TaxID=3452207 RepID=UPI003F89C3C6